MKFIQKQKKNNKLLFTTDGYGRYTSVRGVLDHFRTRNKYNHSSSFEESIEVSFT